MDTDKEIKAIQKEMEKEILSKLDTIRENILCGKGHDNGVNINMLAMINDEVSDVLLNWDDRLLDSRLGSDLM